MNTSPGSGGPKRIGRIKSFFAKEEIAQAVVAQAEAEQAKAEHEQMMAELARMRVMLTVRSVRAQFVTSVIVCWCSFSNPRALCIHLASFVRQLQCDAWRARCSCVRLCRTRSLVFVAHSLDYSWAFISPVCCHEHDECAATNMMNGAHAT